MKALKDWTLGELNEYCDTVGPCSKCNTNVRKYCKDVLNVPPGSWDLSEDTPTIKSTIEWHKYPEDMSLENVTGQWVLIKENDDITITNKDVLTPYVVPCISAWAELPEAPNWDGD